MKTQITCPECSAQIDVNDILKHQLEDTIRKEFLAKEVTAKKALEAKEAKLNQEKEAFELQKSKETEDFQRVLAKKVKESLATEEAKLKIRLQEENSDQFDLLNKELNEKSEKLKELNKSKAEIEKLKREKDELKDSIAAQLQAELNITLSLEKGKIKKASDEANEFKIKEFEKQLADQKKLMEEMKRKHEQGSMQLQGEVQELAMEEWLAQTFPLDTIDEIKKGANGADCLQIVNTREQQNCGKSIMKVNALRLFSRHGSKNLKMILEKRKLILGFWLQK